MVNNSDPNVYQDKVGLDNYDWCPQAKRYEHNFTYMQYSEEQMVKALDEEIRHTKSCKDDAVKETRVVRKQRDELLKALEECCECMRHIKKVGETNDPPVSFPLLDKCELILAKARGERPDENQSTGDEGVQSE